MLPLEEAEGAPIAQHQPPEAIVAAPGRRQRVAQASSSPGMMLPPGTSGWPGNSTGAGQRQTKRERARPPVEQRASDHGVLGAQRQPSATMRLTTSRARPRRRPHVQHGQHGPPRPAAPAQTQPIPGATSVSASGISAPAPAASSRQVGSSEGRGSARPAPTPAAPPDHGCADVSPRYDDECVMVMYYIKKR